MINLDMADRGNMCPANWKLNERQLGDVDTEQSELDSVIQ